MLIQERFKSPDKVFEKVYGIFDKRDYFNTLGLAKVQIRNFENFLKKGDKNAQALLDKFKGDKKKSHEYIIQVIHDRKKEQAFEDFKAFKSAVNKLELVSKGKSKEAYGASDLVKSRIHNNSQKYTIALYSAIRKQKFNNYKDVHKDVDDLLAKNEGFSSDAQRKAAFANGYEEKDKKNEGKKRFKRQDGIGKAKYTISFHDGKKKHKDGSDFFDIKIFKNKKDLSNFVGTLVKQGYKLTRESVNEAKVETERYFGKKGIIIMIRDGNKMISAIFKDKKNADKFNRNNPADVKKLLQLAKKTKYPKAIDESMNEASREAMGIAALTGTRGVAVQDFIDKNRINSRKLFNALKKANLQGRINFASALAGKPNNPNAKLTKKLFGEDKKEIITLRKKAKSEKAFYDVLDKIEKKYGRRGFEKWLDKSLKDLKINPSKLKTSADKQEALYQAKL